MLHAGLNRRHSFELSERGVQHKGVLIRLPFRLFAAAFVRPETKPATRIQSATMAMSKVPGAPNLSTLPDMLLYIDLVRQLPWSQHEQMMSIAVVGQRFLLTEADFAKERPAASVHALR